MAVDGGRGIPGRRGERRVLSPDDQNAESVDEHDQQHLGEHRVAQPVCRRHGGLEPRHGGIRDQVPLLELLQERLQSPVHDEFGDDQQRKRHQVADVNFHVEQERHRDASVHQPSLQGREQQQRQPRKHRDDDDALSKHRRRLVGQVRTPQKLEQRPAQHQREIRRIPCRSRFIARRRLHWIHARTPVPHTNGADSAFRSPRPRGDRPRAWPCRSPSRPWSSFPEQGRRQCPAG